MSEKNAIIIAEGTEVLEPIWDPNKDNIKQIIIPNSVTSIKDDTFKFLNGAIISLPHRLWSTLDTDCVAASTSAGDWCESSVVFKAILDDGTYFYSYAATRASYESNDSSSLLFSQFWREDSNIRKYDKYIDECDEGKLKLPAKVMPYLCRLATQYKLSKANEDLFVAFIKKNISHAIKQIALFDCPDMLRVLYRYGMVDAARQKKILAALQEANAVNCLQEFDAISSTKNEAPVDASAKKKTTKPKVETDKMGLVARKGTYKAVEVKLSSGKKFLYTCPYPVSEGDSVLIGVGHGSKAMPSKNSGVSGIVTNTSPEKKLKKDYAVDVAFAFSKDIKAQQLTKIPELLQKSYEDELAESDYSARVYPITFFVRKVLAALTYLQYAEISEHKADFCAFINATPSFSEDDVNELADVSGVEISLSDMKCAVLAKVTESAFATMPGYNNGFLIIPEKKYEEEYEDETESDKILSKKCWEKVQNPQTTFKEMLLSENMGAFLKEYVTLAVAEVLMRCGQTDLLKTYFENCEILPSYAPQLLEMAKELGASECEDLTRSYTANK